MRLEYGDSDVEGASRLLDMKVVKRNVLIFKLGFFLWNFCRSPSRSRSPLPSRQKGRSKSPKRRSVSRSPSGSRSRSRSRSKSVSGS
ncbi:hypothetical protein ERO13_D11G119833v2 [Gossypium hirsutum]|nr:hypothetical protein ERO13_D11G119833v2 [Gossypium hirsutum]